MSEELPPDDESIKIPEVRPNVDEPATPDPLDDTEPHPALVLAGLDWRTGIVAIGLGILCALAAIIWAVKSALDAIE